MGGADWRSTLKDQVAATASAAEGKGISSVYRISRVAFSVDAHPFLRRAAEKRGISLSGYIRRATMAFVARDLGLPARDLFELDAAPVPFDQTRRNWPRGHVPKDLDGEMYGTWETK